MWMCTRECEWSMSMSEQMLKLHLQHLFTHAHASFTFTCALQCAVYIVCTVYSTCKWDRIVRTVVQYVLWCHTWKALSTSDLPGARLMDPSSLPLVTRPLLIFSVLVMHFLIFCVGCFVSDTHHHQYSGTRLMRQDDRCTIDSSSSSS